MITSYSINWDYSLNLGLSWLCVRKGSEVFGRKKSCDQSPSMFLFVDDFTVMQVRAAGHLYTLIWWHHFLIEVTLERIAKNVKMPYHALLHYCEVEAPLINRKFINSFIIFCQIFFPPLLQRGKLYNYFNKFVYVFHDWASAKILFSSCMWRCIPYILWYLYNLCRATSYTV